MNRSLYNKNFSKFIKFLLLVALATALYGLSYMVSSNNSVKSANNSVTSSYMVEEVHDGDTITIAHEGKLKKVRLIGIDTPETQDPRKPVQCFGVQASSRAKELLSGKTITLEYDPAVGTQDKYGRMLAYVFMNDGVNFNQKMIAEGYAHEYTYGNQQYKYQAEFIAAEAQAKAEALGLWSPTTCNGETNQTKAS